MTSNAPLLSASPRVLQETKDFLGSRRAAVTSSWALPPAPIRLLVANGFLLMWAFSTETVYAMFIKVTHHTNASRAESRLCDGDSLAQNKCEL